MIIILLLLIPLGLPKGTLGVEDSEPVRDHPLSDRALSADLVYAISKERNIRGTVIRFAPTVHGKGDHGFVTMLGDAYRQKGSVIYVDDGSARWPAVHREDAAVLVRLALEKGIAGATYHAVAEQGVRIKDLTEVIGKKLQLPLQSASVQEAAGTLGFLGHVIALDNPVSSDKSQKELGWHPTRLGLLADVEANYFT